MQGYMCLAQGHNTVMPVRIKPAAPRSRVKHSTTEPLCSLFYPAYHGNILNIWKDRTIFVGLDLDPNCLHKLSADNKNCHWLGKSLKHSTYENICLGQKNIFHSKTGPQIRVCNRKLFFIISQPKHMFWVLKRTISMRRVF